MKILKSFASISLALFVFNCLANGETFADFEYEIKNGEAILTAYKGKELKVTIPSSIKDVPVTGIGTACFKNNSTLTKVTIPQNINVIGDSAFQNCKAVQEIQIAEGVVSLGHAVFNGCINVKKVRIPKSVTWIGSHVFTGCTSLVEVEISLKVLNMGDKIFTDCSSLEKVLIINNAPNF
jgi:hypothetical protein